MDRYTDINIKEAYDIENPRDIIKKKLRQYYDGRIVRKDLTKSIREGANVPVYVLEYLLGQYCNSDDQEIIDEGVDNVKRILRDNYVRRMKHRRYCHFFEREEAIQLLTGLQ